MLSYLKKEEIEELGYTVDDEDYKFEGRDAAYYNEIYVWKDGFYGILDRDKKELISPCVHTSKELAKRDMKYNGRRPASGAPIYISLQKTLIETIGEENYDPYIGEIVSFFSDELCLPKGIVYANYTCGSRLDQEEFSKALAYLYKLTQEMLKNGTKRIKVYDHGDTPEFKAICDGLGELLDMENCFNSKNEELIEGVKFNRRNFMGGLTESEINRIGRLMNEKPLIEIGPDEAVYYPDVSREDNEKYAIRIRKEDFVKGIPIETSAKRNK